MILGIGFLICTLIIVYSGTKIAKYGDIIAEKSGLGRVWIGLILMATVTSLPELVTGISSVTFAGVPDIAAGDVLGSCAFNLLILVLLDALYRPGPISSKAAQGHVLSASFGILLFCIALFGLLLKDRIFPLGWIGPYSLLFLVIYFTAMKMLYSFEKKWISGAVKKAAAEHNYEGISIKTAVVNFSINAFIVIIAAAFLPKIGEGIARTTGLGQTFVGNIFIALSTSLPELVVSVAAVKMDAVDLAVGNLFGSNLFNMLILAIDDIFFIKGHILAFVSPNHMISAVSIILMTTIAIIGLTNRPDRKRFFIAWDSVCLIIVYAINMILLYVLK